MSILTKKYLVLVVLLAFPVLATFSSVAYARCQSNTSGGYYDPGCDTDYECSQNRDCSIGTVCNYNKPQGGKAGTCESAFGEPAVVNNQIAGGYSLTGSGLGLLINNIVLAVGAVSGLIFFTMLILGGITYMSSQGDEKMVAKAKNQITAGLVGIIIVFMSWWAVKIISVIFGINLLTPSFTGP